MSGISPAYGFQQCIAVPLLIVTAPGLPAAMRASAAGRFESPPPGINAPYPIKWSTATEQSRPLGCEKMRLSRICLPMFILIAISMKQSGPSHHGLLGLAGQFSAAPVLLEHAGELRRGGLADAQ